jgi:transmembrane sensor
MDSNTIESLAAQWLIRQQNESWTNAQQEALNSWLQESTAHLVSYLRLETALRRTDRLRALRAGVLPGVVPPPGSWSNSAPPDESTPPTNEAVAQHKSRKTWLAAAAACIAFLLGSLCLTLMRNTTEQRYATRIGDLTRLTLADGSQVTLNTGTEIRVSLGAGQRIIDLDSGEAFFVVAQDPSRPFVIHAGDKQVIALGTALSVRLFTNSDIRVLVTDGRVQLGPVASNFPEQITVLDAGMLAHTHANQVRVQAASEAQAQQLMSWREGFVTFRDTPLTEAIAELNRYNRRQLVIADPSIATLRVGGKFRCTNVEAFLVLLQRSFPIVTEVSGERILLKHR